MNRLFLFLSLMMLLQSCNIDEPSEDDSVKAQPVIYESEKQNKIDTLTNQEVQIDSTITLDYIMGKFEPTKDKAFAKLETKHATRIGLYLRKETYEAFRQMHDAAKKDGVQLKILSATRNFNSQKGIWEAKWQGTRKIENGKDASKAYPNPKTRALKILEYSSMPGSSRHHWGTDIDINNLTNEYFAKGKGLKEYQWLTTHAHKYGFCQPYTAGRPHGYHEEKWHWSYLPVAQPLSDQAKLRLKDEMIKGFKGSEVATQIGIVEKYVLGINPKCL